MLDELGREFGTNHLNQALSFVAKDTLSIWQAQKLIDLGADVDYRYFGATSPQLAARSKGDPQKAAAFMVFLLRQGANSSIQLNGINICDEVVPRKMKEALDITWDEFVDKQEELRRQSAIRHEENRDMEQDEGGSDEDDQLDISDG